MKNIGTLITEQDLINAGAELRDINKEHKLYEMENRCYSVYKGKVGVSWEGSLKQYRGTKKIALENPLKENKK